MMIMNNEKELTIELAKNKADEIIVKQELNEAKLKFIEELNETLGKDLKIGFNNLNKPIKIKRTFKDKVKKFFKRINNILSN